MASKHFFEGYSRSRDTLMTLANKICEATIVNPWTIKSSGRIPTQSDLTFLSLREHVCLKRTLSNGLTVNVLLYDDFNLVEDSVNYGNIKILIFMHDGFDIANNRLNFMESNTFTTSLQYHTTSSPDVDDLPNFSWHWIWVDDYSIGITVFGNTGVAGSATPKYSSCFLGLVDPVLEQFNETFIYHDLVSNVGKMYDNLMVDYVDPTRAPATFLSRWGSSRAVINFKTLLGYNVTDSNPQNSLFIAKRFDIAQGCDWSSGTRDLIHTHKIKNDVLLCCQPGRSTADNALLRGDIVTIDRNNCDYIFQALNTGYLGGDIFHYHILIKRMESAHDLTAVNITEGISLEWTNPLLCQGVRVVRKEGSEPLNYSDGDIIFDETKDTTLTINGVDTFLDTNVTNGVTYYYKVFAYSSNNVVSIPVSNALAIITR